MVSVTAEDVMTKVRRNDTLRLLGVVRRNRPALMMSTALQTTVMLVLSLPAGAQPAPNARPIGGSVVAGAAAISQTTGNTRIDQSTQRAAIDWRSFDVGSQQSVTFNQPSASAVALNRVTGPDPSQIAGRIDANGQIILVNQSGVNFYNGAQVNAAGVMVSAANISNANFMAGVMKFDQPGNPNAKIDNQGTITIKETGLAALVAPQVANSGTISAKLGHVVLAGAKTATLDLFGDGLLSLDVTNQVTQAPVGPDGKAATALVTNTGVLVAEGGTVQLTARAADGVVQNLVQAGGSISAATVGAQTGVVALNGVGGSIVVEGQLSAPGLAAGTKGGAIQVASNRDVVVAASAKIDASGAAGGGVAAIGTTLARAKGGPSVTPTLTAANTVIRPGAKITADATNKGDGGRVTVLSTTTTDMAGAITAKGGPQGGNGGFVEVSGDTGFSLTGTVDVSAPTGALGSILLDPQDLFISATNPDEFPGPITPNPTGVPADGLPDAKTDSWITPDSIAGLKGAVTIATTRDLIVMSLLDTTESGITTLTLNAGNDLTVNVKADITTAGSILLSAGNITPTGTLTLNSPISSTAGSIFLQAHAGNIKQAAAVTANGPDQLVSFRTDGSVVFSASGAESGAQIQASGGTIELGPTTDNTFLVDVGFIHDFVALAYRIGQTTEPFTKNPGPKASTVNLGDIGAVGETMSFTNVATIDLQAHGAITETVLSITNLNQTGLTLTGSGGPVNLGAAGNTFTKLGKFTGNGDFTLTNSNALDITGPVNAGTGAVTLQITGGLTETGGTITAGTLTGSAATATLNGANSITNLGSFTAPGGLSLTTVSALNIAGPVNVGDANLTLKIGGALTERGGTITAGTVTGSSVGTFSLTNPANAILQSSGITSTNGDVILVDGSNLILTGKHSGNNLFFEVAKAGGTLTLGDFEFGRATVTATGNGRISLVADNYVLVGGAGNDVPSSITTTGGTVELAPVSPINISLLGTGGLVVDPTLVPIIHTNGGTLAVGGFTDLPAGKTAPAASAKSVTIDGAVDLTDIAATLRLDSTGSITQPGGDLTVANLTGSAGTFASLIQPTNLVDTLGAFSTKAGFALVDDQALLVAGPVTDTGAASTLALTTKTGGITLAGPVSATNIVDLTSAGAINQTAGVLIAGTLTGSAATSASLTQPTNLVGTLGAFSTKTGFALVDNQPLLVAGPVKDTGAVSTLALTTKTGDITLTGDVSAGSGTIRINSDGNITQSGSSTVSSGPGGTVAVHSTGDLIQLGTARIFGDTVDVSAEGKLQQSDNAFITTVVGGTLNTDTVTTGGDVIQTGNGAILAANALKITAGGSLSQTDSASILSSNSSITISVKGGIALSGNASVTAPTISLTGGPRGILLTGNATMGQNGSSIDITSTGPVSEAPTSKITANSITSSGGVNGDVTLLGSGNAINVFHDFSAINGDLVLVDGTDLALFGPLKANNLFFEVAKAGGTLTLGIVNDAPPPSPAALPATLNAVATGGRISLVADNYVVLPTGVPPSSSITTNAGTVELAPFSATGTNILASGGLVPLIHTGGGTLEVGAFTNVPAGATVPAASANSVSVGPTDLTGVATTLRLDSTGPITETSGGLTVTNLTGSAGTFASLTQPANLVGTLGAFSTKAGFALVNNKSLLVTGPVQDSGSASTLALTTRTGDITLAGSVSATNGVDLNSAGAISQIGGSFLARTLTGNAATLASLTQPTNMVGTLGAFSTKAGLALVNDQALRVAGPVADTGAASTLALTTKIGDITLAGSVSAANIVNLTSAGAINQTSGSLIAGTLTGSAGTIVSLTQPTNLVGTLDTFTAATSFILNDAGDLLIAGVLSAPNISISAQNSTISLGDGASIVTGGSTRPPGPINTLLEPSNGAPGALLQAANFTQIGSSTVLGLGSGPATLQIATTGHAQFDPPLGLQATGAWLILDLAQRDRRRQRVRQCARRFLHHARQREPVRHDRGRRRRPAAAQAFIRPAINANYLFNGCVIAAAVCQPTTTPISADDTDTNAAPRAHTSSDDNTRSNQYRAHRDAWRNLSADHQRAACDHQSAKAVADRAADAVGAATAVDRPGRRATQHHLSGLLDDALMDRATGAARTVGGMHPAAVIRLLWRLAHVRCGGH